MTDPIDASEALDLAILALTILTHPDGTTTREQWQRLDDRTPCALQVLADLRHAAQTVVGNLEQAPTRDTIYCAYDRWVCLQARCAGLTASATGVTIGGYRLTALTALDVTSWTTATTQDHVSCECGRLRAAVDANGRIQIENTHK